MNPTPLQEWLDRPMGETERMEITRRAQANAEFHRFNCNCERCSDRRRAVCDGNGPNRARLLSAGEARALTLADRAFAVLGFLTMAAVVILITLHFALRR